MSTRRSSRLAQKSRRSYNEYSDDKEDVEGVSVEGVSDDNVAVLLDIVNAVKATREIEHLLTAKARRLPFYEAIHFIRFDSLKIEDFRLLLSLGWTIPGVNGHNVIVSQQVHTPPANQPAAVAGPS